MKRSALVVVASLAVVVLETRAQAESLPPVIGMVEAQTMPDDHFVEDVPPQKPVSAHDFAADENQIRLELGIGAPGGLMAVRYSRVLASGTRIEPAVGLAYTGVLGSLLVTQPLAEKYARTPGGTPYSATFEIYGGYSASHLREGLHHPWTGREVFVPNGTYHWIDLGISTQIRWRSLTMTTGIGATKLVSGPAGIGGPALEEETFWWVFPEGWLGRQRMAPSLWSSVGWSF